MSILSNLQLKTYFTCLYNQHAQENCAEDIHIQAKWLIQFTLRRQFTYIFLVALSCSNRGVLVGGWRCHPLGGSAGRGPGTGCHGSPGGCCRRSSSACWGAPHCATSGWAASSHTSPGGGAARGHSSTPADKNRVHAVLFCLKEHFDFLGDSLVGFPAKS